jgi:hypothetical protein
LKLYVLEDSTEIQTIFLDLSHTAMNNILMKKQKPEANGKVPDMEIY